MTELWQRSATDLLRAYARRETAPTEVVAALAERIQRLDPDLHAFTTLTLDRATEEARRRTDELGRGQRGPLHGIPVAIKELFDVEGAVTSFGSPIFHDRVPRRDAEAVRRLRAAGAIVLGLTRSHEFGWGITTQQAGRGGTRNPWDLTRVPGGSSGGSAAALAAGLTPVALGSDTGGSIRIPGSFCGVCGIKPTHGRVNAQGALPLAPSLDHVGPMARTVADCALTLSVLADEPGPELTAEVKGVRVGLCPDLQQPPLAADHAVVLDRAIAALRAGSATVHTVRFPDAADIRPAFTRVQQAEAYDVHSRILGTFPGRKDEYGADVRGRLDDAARVTMPEYFAARQRAGELRGGFDALFREVDVLLTPVAACGPPSIADPDHVMHEGTLTPLRDLVLPYTVPQDLFGLPACVVPAGFDRQGMPVGLQVTAAKGREVMALSVAAALSASLSLVPAWPSSIERLTVPGA